MNKEKIPFTKTFLKELRKKAKPLSKEAKAKIAEDCKPSDLEPTKLVSKDLSGIKVDFD